MESTPLLVLRALQIGLRVSDLEEITLGDLFDMLTESLNDNYDYPYKATREDLRNF